MIELKEEVSDPRGTLGVLAVAFAFLSFASLRFALEGASLIAHPASFATLAVVHAFAGFIVLSIVAAAHQLIPVLTGTRSLPAWTALVLATPIAAGFALLVAAFRGLRTFEPAAIVVGAGIAAWASATLLRLIFGPREPRTRVAFALAVFSLLGSAAVGVPMALTFGGLQLTDWLALAPIHALLAIVGFVSAVIVTVSYRLVPMFALSRTSNGALRFLPALVIPSLAMVTGFAWLDSTRAFRAAMLTLLVVLTAFVAIQADTIRRRLRRQLDMSLCYAIVSWIFALLATLAGAAATYAPSLARIAVLFALLGWITPAILGYAYKIVAFLAWQQARERFPGAPLQPLSGAVDRTLASAALLALSVGLVGSAADAVFGPALPGVSQALYGLGVLLSLVVLVQIVARYRRPLCRASSTAGGSIPRSRSSVSFPSSTR